jgi:uncharacterized protein (TIGR02996 family)
MARNDDLLRAVVTAPRDDAPRLVYADWLEEQGDRDRAAFIRTQCELARRPADDPRRPDLAAREQDLLDRHGWEWAEELGPKVREWVFSRGFVERVEMDLDTASAEEIGRVLQTAPVRHLRDTNQLNSLVGVVGALPQMGRLTGLELWTLYGFRNPPLKKILTSPFLAGLKTLIVQHDRNGAMADEQVTVEALNSPHRANLEVLAIHGDGTWRGPTLEVLRALAESRHLRKLRVLNLSNAGDPGNHPLMDAATARLLGQSPNLANLEALDLGHASFPLDAWDEVLKWPCLARLKWLRLYRARQVNPPDYHTVADIKDLPDYRRAFEEKVANIDWDLWYVRWDNGPVGWSGLSWAGLEERHLFAMWPYVERGDFDGLEAAYRADCLRYAGEKLTAALDGVRLDRYQRDLEAGLRQAVAAAGQHPGATSIYLRVDSYWGGEFHVAEAPVAEPFEPRREDSYPGPVAEFPGPEVPGAADLRDRLEATGRLDPGAAEHYLAARVVAAFGRVATATPSPVPVYVSVLRTVYRVRGGG